MLFHLAVWFWVAAASNPDFWRGAVEIGNEYKVSGGPGGELGFSVSLQGNLAALGAPGFGNFLRTVHIYEHVQGQWTPVAFLEASDPQDGDDFGFSVSLGGDVLVVGAPRRDTYAAGTGAAYVFLRDQNTGEWFESQVLLPDDLSANADFGGNVDIEGNMLVVTAPRQNDRGAAYIYERSGDEWIHVQTLTRADTDAFGASSQLSADRLLIGAALENNQRGAAYVYRFNGSQWMQEQRLIAPDRTPGDFFGNGGALSGNLAVVGATSDQIGKHAWAGSAYIFRRVNGVWTFEQKITQPEPLYESFFGDDIHIHEGVIYVAAPFERFLTHAQGALYTFEHNGTEWVNTLRLVPSDAVPPTYGGQAFGVSIDTDGNTLLVGALRDDTHGTNSGAGYFYIIGPGSTADLTDVSIAFGTLISGGLPELLASDDQWLRARSRPGFAAEEANLIEVRIGAETTNFSAAALDLSVEGRISQPGGIARWRLRQWTTGQFIQVHQHSINQNEATEEASGVDANGFIRQADGRIELSIRQSVFATFSALGFDSFTDRVVIELE